LSSPNAPISTASPFMTAVTHKQLADLEVTPDAELVLGVDLADRDPFMVRPDRSELAVREARARRREHAARVRIVRVSAAGLPGVVRDLMVIPSCVRVRREKFDRVRYIPDSDPGPSFMSREKRSVSAVECKTLPVVFDGGKLSVSDVATDGSTEVQVMSVHIVGSDSR
jgi:hypothetical protein